ncbi:hypothetical protein CC80DRAFT_537739 [Byssothecium circinans]|uniref:Uncharacterized protein n=1 Tax=Byssothecium circinans TaxID=147558 RepID=A0A6A5TNA9_9PLEO|nr:hypothetical protein CC80DRAFT_537739 [Byssothecium circinans]
MSNKFLNDAELNEHWDWYRDWCAHDDELPELDDEDYEMICNMIEELFQHIHHQEKAITRLEGEVMGSLGALKKDIAEFKSRDPKYAGTFACKNYYRADAFRAWVSALQTSSAFRRRSFLRYPIRLCLDDVLSAYYPRQPRLMGDNCFSLAVAGHNDRYGNGEDVHGKAWQGTMKGSATADTSGGRNDENKYRKALGVVEDHDVSLYSTTRRRSFRQA